MFIGLKKSTGRYEYERGFVHLHSADVDNVVDIKYEPVGVVYQAVDKWDEFLDREWNETRVRLERLLTYLAPREGSN